TPGAMSCRVNYTNNNDWGSGATINITITNLGTSPINGWTLTWSFPGNQIITNLWNGSYTQTGASVSVSNLGYNATILANGGTTALGFNLSYNGANNPPPIFNLNSSPCQ
ncbi:MAG: hypothetical protein EHM40_04420, partial [Chloroflexi bacterium]